MIMCIYICYIIHICFELLWFKQHIFQFFSIYITKKTDLAQGKWTFFHWCSSSNGHGRLPGPSIFVPVAELLFDHLKPGTKGNCGNGKLIRMIRYPFFTYQKIPLLSFIQNSVFVFFRLSIYRSIQYIYIS